MAFSTIKSRYDNERSQSFVCFDDPIADIRSDLGLIHKSNHHGLRRVCQCLNTSLDRRAHTSVIVGIVNEFDGAIACGFADILGAMTRYDYDLARARSKQIVKAAFDESLTAKGEQLFEFAHSS